MIDFIELKKWLLENGYINNFAHIFEKKIGEWKIRVDLSEAVSIKTYKLFADYYEEITITCLNIWTSMTNKQIIDFINLNENYCK
jgi:hypothetical protein